VAVIVTGVRQFRPISPQGKDALPRTDRPLSNRRHVPLPAGDRSRRRGVCQTMMPSIGDEALA
jgi:hypothetical protein